MKNELEKLDDITDEFGYVLGGAWEVRHVCLDMFHQDEEPTLAEDRALKLDLSKFNMAELPSINIVLHDFKLPSFELAGSRKLPRGIKKNETSDMNVLPHIVQLLIFFHLPVEDVVRCMRVSQEWNQLLNLNDFWCVLLARDYNLEAGQYCRGKESYKLQYGIHRSLLPFVQPDYRAVRERFNNIFDFFPPNQQPNIVRQPWFDRDVLNRDVRFFRANNQLLEVMYRPAQYAMIEADVESENENPRDNEP